jgi:hypothetical protein
MAVATASALGWFAWERLQAPPPRDPPRVGAVPPSLRLVDVETGEPLLLFGLRGKVVWVTFWSAQGTGSRTLLAELDRVEPRLHGRGRFTMVAVAADRDRPAAVRAVARRARAAVPVYLGTAETLRAYGAVPGRLPLHVLIDDDGRIGVVAQGSDAATVARLARQAEQWLDVAVPFGGAHFAGGGGGGRRARDGVRFPAP